MNPEPLSREALDTLQRDTFTYFKKETNPLNGLVPDSTRHGSHCSIAAVGLGLAAYPVAVERNFISREEAVDRVLATLQFFWQSPQGTAPDATGHKGFYYHFLHMDSGRRAWNCELSTIDSTILIAGALTAATYFDHETEQRTEHPHCANDLIRMDWLWAQSRRKF